MLIDHINSTNVFFVIILTITTLIFVSAYLLSKKSNKFFYKLAYKNNISINNRKILINNTFFYISIILTIVFTSFTYKSLGNFSSLSNNNDFYGNLSKLKQNKIREVGDDLKRNIYKLEYMVANNSKDLDAWWQLAKLYDLIKDYPKSEYAFRQAYELQPENNNILSQYIIVSSKANDGILKESLVSHAKDLTSINPAFYNILAINAFKLKKYNEAIINWENFKKFYKKQHNSDNHNIENIDKMLSIARKK